MRWLWQRIQDEPAMTYQMLNALVLLAVGFGLSWTGEQVALVGMFLAAVLGWLTRKAVTPVAKYTGEHAGDG